MPRIFVVLFVLLSVFRLTPNPVDLDGTASVGSKPTGDAIVWLDAPSATRPTRTTEVTLDQRNLAFAPQVLAVRAGTKVSFPNNDRVFHNVFSYHEGARFDLGLYPVGTVQTRQFNDVGLSRIFCNIHPQMAAYLMVVDTPYFAVSDSTGRFTIRGVPSGTYRYHAWRPGGPTLTESIAVQPGKTFDIRWP